MVELWIGYRPDIPLNADLICPRNPAAGLVVFSGTLIERLVHPALYGLPGWIGAGLVSG